MRVMSIDSFICATCGTQYGATTDAPERCVICDEERQYVPETGQAWTRLQRLQMTHRNAWQQYEPALWGIGTEPSSQSMTFQFFYILNTMSRIWYGVPVSGCP